MRKFRRYGKVVQKTKQINSKIEKSLCYKCISYGGNYNQHDHERKTYRQIDNKIIVVCIIYDPYMPVMKKRQCKYFAD